MKTAKENLENSAPAWADIASLENTLADAPCFAYPKGVFRRKI
jgi:hypothetical protein